MHDCLLWTCSHTSMASSMVEPPTPLSPPLPEIFLSPSHSDMSPQYHFFKITLPPNPMVTLYKLWNSIRLRAQIVRGGRGGGGNILFINIKIECLAVQDLKIMAFRFLKTLVLWLFDFVPPYRLIPPIHFRKIEMTTKNSGGFIRWYAPIFQGKDDMTLWFH